MKAEEFDEKFDAGEDITAYLDINTIRRLGYEQQRVNVDFPTWMIEALDREAARIGVTRQSIIKVWIAERLEQHGNLKPKIV
ncbi:MAG: BrnA antitoxin family protein [Nostoc sp. LLA-1]|nr:BrnA antitoxin family protein [Cyanocohniella sp. LLY]